MPKPRGSGEGTQMKKFIYTYTHAACLHILPRTLKIQLAYTISQVFLQVLEYTIS
jgi:uncharacterized membrane protein YwzB